MELRRLLINVSLFSSAVAYSQVSSSIEEHFSPMPDIINKAWENPALRRYEYSSPLTTVGGMFYNSSKERYGEFKAETFTKIKKVVITAHASYDNGARHYVRFCENADISKVYPYLTYDAVGGNQNLERYSFGGDVSVKINEKWDVGAKLSYDAGLYSRSVDPRPKNTSGTFIIGAGGAYSLGHNYALGMSASYEKYKQSCDIMFKSELGVSKIYHLTGLGTHYKRFSGQGESSYYSGNSFEGHITLLPLTSGLYFEANLRRETINQILEDFNNLPLTKSNNTEYSVQAGYKGDKWIVVATADISRRHGYENIFGDAATGQYPQIGTLAMYLANSNQFDLRASVEVPILKVSLFINPQVGYNHYREIYREPRKVLSVDNMNAAIECKAITTVAKKVVINGSLGYQFIKPFSHSFENIVTSEEDLQPYLQILKQGYQDAITPAHNLTAGLGGDLLISKGKYAIGLEIAYSRNKLAGDHSTFSASFKF